MQSMENCCMLVFMRINHHSLYKIIPENITSWLPSVFLQVHSIHVSKKCDNTYVVDSYLRFYP